MRTSTLLDELRAARAKAADGSTRKAVLDRLEACLEDLRAQARSEETPDRTRAKILAFLDHFAAAHEKLGVRLFQPGFVLNTAGEAMARAGLISRPVVELLQVGLYFFGFDQIERRWSSRAAVYSGIHADYLQEYLGRESLKAVMLEAAQLFARGRVFCLTWHYLNSLRKAYWKHCRESEDALDVAVTGEVALGVASEPAAPPAEAESEGPDRVALMLGIFQRELTARQRWIYLAKNRSSLAAGAVHGPALAGGEPLAALFAELGDPSPGADFGWTEIALALGINEKTAKREYLKALHVLLKESAEAVFGMDRIPSNYVRRVLESIRAVVYEKDLRLKQSTGRGLNTLVEKWEVALRFVLNHQRVSA